MRIVAIIQARMGSTRLPGKVLSDLCGETVLARVVSRVRQCRYVNEVIVATSVDPADNAIVQECCRHDVCAFRGSECDVLDRYYWAAQRARADAVARITADCPLIDPDVSDKTIQAFVAQQADYASNVLQRTYPRGLDTEVMTIAALGSAWKDAWDPCQREHVTPFLYQHPDRFGLVSVTGERDYSNYRWTLDTAEDLQFLRAVYERCAKPSHLRLREVLRILEREPNLAEINQHVRQKAI